MSVGSVSVVAIDVELQTDTMMVLVSVLPAFVALNVISYCPAAVGVNKKDVF